MEYQFRIKNLKMDWEAMDWENIKEYNHKENFHNGLLKIVDNEVWDTDSKDGVLKPMSWIADTDDKDKILDDFLGYGLLLRDWGLFCEYGESVFLDKDGNEIPNEEDTPLINHLRSMRVKHSNEMEVKN